jgi:hypothetical protein
MSPSSSEFDMISETIFRLSGSDINMLLSGRQHEATKGTETAESSSGVSWWKVERKMAPKSKHPLLTSYLLVEGVVTGTRFELLQKVGQCDDPKIENDATERSLDLLCLSRRFFYLQSSFFA